MILYNQSVPSVPDLQVHFPIASMLFSATFILWQAPITSLFIIQWSGFEKLSEPV